MLIPCIVLLTRRLARQARKLINRFWHEEVQEILKMKRKLSKIFLTPLCADGMTWQALSSFNLFASLPKSCRKAPGKLVSRKHVIGVHADYLTKFFRLYSGAFSNFMF